ncbi:MAG: hypothetical protein CMH41_08080 [Micrococcales bacterium]|nr:hypothetical protein [Micrococcales bacterium]
MNLMYKVKHYTNKVLYTFFGPAELDEHNDPVLRMNREYAEKLGKLPAASEERAEDAIESASKVKAIA